MKAKILVVDDEEMIHGSFLLALRGSGLEDQLEIDFAFSAEKALDLFSKNPFEYAVAFVDYLYEKKGIKSPEGHLLVKKLKELNPCMTTIIMSGDGSEEAIKDWMDSGVDKFIFKPFSNETIRAMIENSLEGYSQNFLLPKTTSPKIIEQEKMGLVGISENIKNICKLALKFSKSDHPSLIFGETGTGKSLIAKGIHDHSSHSEGPFTTMNCAAISKSLFESELFEHFKENKKGTLFLDEIHHLTLEQQALLLRVIQDKQVTPLGEKRPIDVDFKLVVSAKQNLKEMAESRDFLADLYFCISSLNLTILPLRERSEDIIPTVHHFQKEIENRLGETKQIMRSTMQKLTAYSWPGNICELKGELERLNVIVDRKIIRESDLSKHILEQKSFSYYRNGNLLTMSELSAKQKKQEVALIIKALKQADNNISKASNILDMRRTTLSSKMEQYGLRGKDISILEIIFSKKGERENEELNQKIYYHGFAE